MCIVLLAAIKDVQATSSTLIGKGKKKNSIRLEQNEVF